MPPSDEFERSGVPEIDAAVSKIAEGDALAESGERVLAAGQYHEAILQLKGVRERTDGRVREIAGRLLQCVNKRGRRLIDEDSVPGSGDVDAVLEEAGTDGESGVSRQDTGEKADQGQSYVSSYRAVRERIAEGDRFRRDEEYEAAIAAYEEAKTLVEHQLTGSSGKTLETEINVGLRNARRNIQSEPSDELKEIYRDIRERMAEGDRLRSRNEYAAAIECYEEAADVIDQRLTESGGKTLQTEVELNLRKARRQRRVVVQRIAKLDSAVQQLDYELLARHGFELPYRRAVIASETVEEPPEVVYTPPSKLEVIDAMTAYYDELGSVEQQLASVATEGGQPTAVTEPLGEMLTARHPNVQGDPDGEQAVVGAAKTVLEGYSILLQKDDDDGVSELTTRLEKLRNDRGADAVDMAAQEVVRRLHDVRSWIGERARRVDLQSQASDVRNKWPGTAGTHLNLDVDVVARLTGTDAGEPSLSQFNSGLEVAERLVTLASEVETVREDYRTPLVDELPAVFGEYLHTGNINGARIDRLEEILNAVEAALDAHRQHPSHPFDRVVDYMYAELNAERFDEDTAALLQLIENAVAVLEFLNRVDAEHPSVQPAEWKESVDTGLKTVSPELVEPVAALVDRMSETYWERHHLYQFEWEEFERLVALVFESNGYETRATQATRDGGVDIWAQQRGDRVAIEVKQFDTGNLVGRPVLQKLASHIATGDADQVIVVTSSDFTDTARQYAKDFDQKMRLIDGTQLAQMLTESDQPPPLTG